MWRRLSIRDNYQKNGGSLLMNQKQFDKWHKSLTVDEPITKTVDQFGSILRSDKYFCSECIEKTHASEVYELDALFCSVCGTDYKISKEEK